MTARCSHSCLAGVKDTAVGSAFHANSKSGKCRLACIEQHLSESTIFDGIRGQTTGKRKPPNLEEKLGGWIFVRPADANNRVSGAEQWIKPSA